MAQILVTYAYVARMFCTQTSHMTCPQQVGPAISNGDAAALPVAGAWRIAVAASGRTTLSWLLDGLAVRTPRAAADGAAPQRPAAPQAGGQRQADSERARLPQLTLLAPIDTDSAGHSVRIAVDWPGDNSSAPWPVALASTLGVRVYSLRVHMRAIYIHRHSHTNSAYYHICVKHMC